MKKFIFLSVFTSLIFAAFLPNKEYSCTTVGLTFKENNQTINVPNNAKTVNNLKKTLKNLYSLKIKFANNDLFVSVNNENNDTLKYLKKYKTLDVYITSDKQGLMFVDNNQTQIGFMIPSQKTMIYYQCK